MEEEDETIRVYAERMRNGPKTMNPLELAGRACDVEYVEGSRCMLLPENTPESKMLIFCLVAHYVKEYYGMETGKRYQEESEIAAYNALYTRVTKFLLK